VMCATVRFAGSTRTMSKMMFPGMKFDTLTRSTSFKTTVERCPGGLRHRVDLLELPNRHLRVHLRALQVRVAEHFLNEADVRAAFEHQRRHRVAEHVTRARGNRFSIFGMSRSEAGLCRM
jgi:hypothetical protein